jgi:hypothetical protein
MLVEARLELDEADGLLALFRRLDQRGHERRVVARPIDRRLDPDDRRIARALSHESVEARPERRVGVVHEDVPAPDLVEDRPVRRREPRARDPGPGLVLELRARKIGELADVDDVEQSLHEERLLLTRTDTVLDAAQHPRRCRAGDLEPHNLAEPTPPELQLDRLEQVVRLVRHFEVGVPRDAKRRALDDLHLREEHGEEVADDALERQVDAPRAERQKPRQDLRHLDACEPLLAGLRVADEEAEAQRQAGDVRERLARADGERREHREDLALEPALQFFELALVAVLDVRDDDAFLLERRPELALPQPRLLRGQVERAFADLVKNLGRRPAVGRAHADACVLLTAQAGDTHHEELVEV